MGNSSAPEFPYPGGTPGMEPADPVAGRPGHFAWSKWIKQFVKRLDRESVKISGDTMTGSLTFQTPGSTGVNIGNSGSALVTSGPIVTPDPTHESHLVNKKYVDNKVPPYYEALLTANALGWATPSELKSGAVVYSIVDVSVTPSSIQILLNPTNNTLYLGPNVSRKIRLWYT